MKSPAPAEALVPVHVMLRSRVQEIDGLNNPRIAQALGYPRTNVVAMLLNGSMKVPLAKIPALADVLKLDPVGLLRRVLLEYEPEVWAVIADTVGGDRLVTENERDLLTFIRGLLGGDDLAMTDDPTLTMQMSALVLAAAHRHARSAAVMGIDDPGRGSDAARLNAELKALLQRQAAERADLLRAFWGASTLV